MCAPKDKDTAVCWLRTDRKSGLEIYLFLCSKNLSLHILSYFVRVKGYIICNNKMLKQKCTCFVVSFALRAEKSQNHNNSILTSMSDMIRCLARVHWLDALDTCTKESTLQQKCCRVVLSHIFLRLQRIYLQMERTHMSKQQCKEPTTPISCNHVTKI